MRNIYIREHNHINRQLAAHNAGLRGQRLVHIQHQGPCCRDSQLAYRGMVKQPATTKHSPSPFTSPTTAKAPTATNNPAIISVIFFIVISLFCVVFAKL